MQEQAGAYHAVINHIAQRVVVRVAHLLLLCHIVHCIRQQKISVRYATKAINYQEVRASHAEYLIVSYSDQVVYVKHAKAALH